MSVSAQSQEEIYAEALCGVDYQQSFERVFEANGPNLDATESKILLNYPNSLCWYKGDKKLSIIEKFRRAHTQWLIQWWTKNYTGKPPYVNWNDQLDRVLLNFSNLMFRIDLGDEIISEETRQGFREFAEAMKQILTTICQSNPIKIEDSGLPLLRQILLMLFYLTLDTDLAVYLKSLGLVDLMNTSNKISNNDAEVQLQSYRILAVVMSESDLKSMQNVSGIAGIFLNFIRSSIKDGIISVGRLQNTLRGLKALSQHDQIREELIKADCQNLMFDCILNTQYDLIKVKLPAMEILLCLLSFNKEFSSRLKTNEKFMAFIRSITSSSETDVQKVTTGLLWKLEKESQNDQQQQQSAQSTTRRSKYDIMISYSHANKELCHRIYERLKNDNLIVWIDAQLMHGATFDAMAEAIENCEYVLICMSDSYKQSAFCEMEASYAVKCRRHIVPLVMTPSYKADGWLGILSSKYIYVDFPKFGFDRAYDELKRQLTLIKQTSTTVTNRINVPQLTNNNGNDTVAQVPIVSVPTTILTEYPPCIDNWNEDHVKSFLVYKKLNIFLSILDSMNGALVHQFYKMCQANQQGMFLSCKEEINRYYQGSLTLKDYLMFQNEMKKYIPQTVPNSTGPASVVCNLM